MPSAPVKPATLAKCPHCRGELETLGQGRSGMSITRCRSCGREPSDANAGVAPSPRATSSVVASRCPVTDCPGTLDSASRCQCCERRRAWIAAHMPKRECKICLGPITGRTSMKYCPVCKPIAQKVQIANHDKKTSPSATSGK